VPVTEPPASFTHAWAETSSPKPFSSVPQYCGSTAAAVPGAPAAGVPVTEGCFAPCDGLASAAAIGSTTTPTTAAARATVRTCPRRRELTEAAGVGVRFSFVPGIRLALPRW